MFEMDFEERDRNFRAEFSEAVENSGSGRVNYGKGLKFDPETRTLSVDTADTIGEGDGRPLSAEAAWRELAALEEFLRSI